jgi:putative transposase
MKETFFMERKEKIEDNQLYHIYNRGNNKQKIFLCHQDYMFFLKRLGEYSKRYSVNIFVYCLMPNHYHLIISQNSGGNLPQMMDTLATSVAKRFNLKYGHVGHLFQGPYKNKKIDSGVDFIEVARYIHINPVLAVLVENPRDWRYSNYAKIEVLLTANFVEYNL